MPFTTATAESLRPTLWRTCRVLANKIRLQILRELCRRPEQSVSDIARRLGLSLPLTSQSLRALNARGLLHARRSGKFVYYRPCANGSIPDSSRLLQAIQAALSHDKQPEKNIFQYCTAFTHPRRIIIIQTLYGDSLSLQELALKTKIPASALDRHLCKLMRRGFLSHAGCKYTCAIPRHQLARVLLHLAK